MEQSLVVTMWQLLVTAFNLVFVSYPIWLPIILGFVFWDLWLHYVRAAFFAKQKYSLIEIKLPKEILKSPLAMELFLTSLYQTAGETTFIDRYWEGKTRPWFSLELVSMGGQVKFFIWTRSFWRNLIEAQLYAQYPDVEVHEAEDYTLGVEYEPGKNMVWGCQFKLNQPDPYPIKTYIDYGLDKDPKEEFKVDPLTPVLEFLGSIKPSEQVWIQILIRAHKKEKTKGPFSEKIDWKKTAEAEIKKIIESSGNKDDEKNKGSMFNLTKGQTELIASIERSINKLSFDCGIRGLYVSNKEAFDPIHIMNLRGSMKQYNSSNANGFSATDDTGFSYPWEDFREKRTDEKKKGMLEAYKKRGYFFYPYKNKPFVLSTEELATIYHFPGKVASTPSFTRIPSKKAQPPSNLPI